MCTYISRRVLTHLISSKGSSDHFRYLIYSKKTTFPWMIDEYLLKIKETTRAKTQLQKTSITSSLYESGLKSRWPTDKYRNRKVFIMLNTCFRQISNIRDIYYWGLLLFGKAYQAKFVLVSLHIDTGPYGQNWNQNNHRNNVMERAKPQKLKIR